MSLSGVFRPGMRVYFVPLAAGVALAASAFLPWVVVGDTALKGVQYTAALWVAALGAAAALECLATALALRDGVLPPTANYSEPDPECDLDVIPNQARRAQVEYALSNSFAFGGLNAVLALRKG